LERGTGIGGLSCRARSVAALADWYEQHRGIPRARVGHDDGSRWQAAEPMVFRIAVLPLALSLLVACSNAAHPEPPATGSQNPMPVPARAADPPPRPAPTASAVIDHHVHLLGPELIRDWKSVGARFSRPDPTYLSPAALLESGASEQARPGPAIDRVVLVPMAHLYANSGMRESLGSSLEQEQAKVRMENDHVSREAARWPGRAVALCSVNPLRPYAQEELDRCKDELRVAGIKVHVASNQIDLREAEHRAALARLAGSVDAANMTLLIHLDPQRRGHTREHITAFANAVLGPHPRLRVIVAHLGGSGGYADWTQAVFGSLLDWLEARQADGDSRDHVYFDISAVYLERESEGVPATTPAQAAALAVDLRRAGLDRLLFGSDYPVFDPGRYARLLRDEVGLTEAELATIQANSPPGLFPR
jgi:uncharacterized protein